MCRRIQCSQCGKPSFAGCGAHVEQVLAGVPVTDRCHCRDAAKKPGEGKSLEHPSWLKRLLGK